MKTLTFICMLALACHETTGQGVFTNHTNDALVKVISDYKSGFSNIRGSQIRSGSGGSDYRSNVEIPGAIECVVTTNGGSAAMGTWRSVLYESSDYNETVNRYRQLFTEIKNSIVKIEGQKPFILSGQYESPSQEKAFSSSTFNLLPSIGDMQSVRVSIILSKTRDTWKIALVVYDEKNMQFQYQARSGN